MELPNLKIQSRSREFNQYPAELREKAVLEYLFNKKTSYSKIDKDIFKYPNYGTGYQSMGALHHYGLYDAFKGKFMGLTYEEALDEIPDDPQYDFIRDIITRKIESDSITCGEESIDVSNVDVIDSGTIDIDDFGFSKKALTNIRVHQNVFREKILCAYHSSCCITGICEPRMLIASHIKPWCVSDPEEKLDVQNGLCLNALHDSAFDSGLITVDPETYSIKLSRDIEKRMPQKTYEDYFSCYDGSEIILPDHGCEPNRMYLKFHNEKIFEKKFSKTKITYEISTMD